jgi:hypothetical protein
LTWRNRSHSRSGHQPYRIGHKVLGPEVSPETYAERLIWAHPGHPALC